MSCQVSKPWGRSVQALYAYFQSQSTQNADVTRYKQFDVKVLHLVYEWNIYLYNGIELHIYKQVIVLTAA